MVCRLIQMFLTNLEDPVIDPAMRAAFIAVSELEESVQVPTLRGLLLSLDPANRCAMMELLRLINTW